MQTSEDSSDGGFLSPDNFSCFFHQANHVLQSFLQSQIPIENSILQSDKALTVNQKAMEGMWGLGGLALTAISRLLLSLLTDEQVDLLTLVAHSANRKSGGGYGHSTTDRNLLVSL